MAEPVARGGAIGALAQTRAFLEGARGFAVQLIPIDPDRVTVKQSPESRRLVYEITKPEGGEPEVLTQDKVFHVRGLSSDGITGTSVVSLFRHAAGLALATEKYGSELFTSDAAVRGVLKHPGTLSDGARTNLHESLHQQKNGTMILEEGLSWEKVGMSAEDAQFLMTRRFQIEEFARWFNLPPHMLKDLEKATFSNIEEQGLEFVKYSMLPWFKRIEEAIRRDLITAQNRFFFKFNVEGLLRGDSKARAEFYERLVNIGVMSRNEVRQKEDLNPKPGLDAHLQPLNMTPVGENSFRGMIESNAGRAASREVKGLRDSYERNVKRHGDGDKFALDAVELYEGLAAYLADAFSVPEVWFEDYVETHRAAILGALAAESNLEPVSVKNVIKRFGEEASEKLASIVLEGLDHERNKVEG